MLCGSMVGYPSDNLASRLVLSRLCLVGQCFFRIFIWSFQLTVTVTLRENEKH